MILTGGYAFLFAVAFSINLIFQTREAGLNAFQLVLIGSVLELTIFLGEVPTGIVADVYGRKRSVLIGLVLSGLGLMLAGAYTNFETIILGHVVYGLGATFMSGAQQAWIADEVGVDRANRVYLRSAQLVPACHFVAVPLAIYLATVDLNTPIIIGGACMIGLAAFLLITMPELGFQRFEPDSDEARPARGLTATLFAGGRLVRGSPLLLTIFGIMFFYGMASEGFDRLWIKHFYDDIGFPSLSFLDSLVQIQGEDISLVWLGGIRMGALLLSVLGVELIRRKINTESHKAVSRALFFINAFQVTGLIVIAGATDFYVGMAAFWAVVTLSNVFDPLYLAWVNQSIESRVRATVLSMSSQVNAIGQFGGGPVLGFVGLHASLKAALYGAAAVMMPALILYMQAFDMDKPDEPEEAASAP